MFSKTILVLAVLCALVLLFQRLKRKNISGAESTAGTGQAASERKVNVTSARLRDMIANNEDFVVLDVRNPDELVTGAAPLKGAVNIPLPDLSNRYSELPRDKPVVVVCKSGFRSANAADFLIREGFKNVLTLKGGMAAYRASEK